tara:strand:- start:36 stop:1250 length:1215 start_codon:yes stop_codon:yes gene_type:complete
MIKVDGPMKKGRHQVFRVRTPIQSKIFNITILGKRVARKMADDFATDANKLHSTGHLDTMFIKYTVQNVIDGFINDFESLVAKGLREDVSVNSYKNELYKIKHTSFYTHEAKKFSYEEAARLETELFKNQVTHKSVKKTMKALKYAFRLAVVRKWLDFNPIQFYKFDDQGTKTNTATKPKQKVVIPSDQQVSELCRVADERERNIYLFAAYTGLRISEIRGLCWSWIDFDNNKIWVKQQADQRNRLTTRLKTVNSDRFVFLLHDTKTMLLDWRAKTQPVATIGHNSQNYAFNDVNDGVRYDLVFAKDDGTPIQRQYIHRLFAHHKKLANINLKGSTHCFRHLYASKLIDEFKNKEISQKHISRLLGHRNSAYTEEVYGHLLVDAKKEQKLVETLSNSENFRHAI